MKKRTSFPLKGLTSVLIVFLTIAPGLAEARQLLEKKVIQRYLNEIWTDSQQELYSYNKKGKVKETIYQSKQETDWVNQYKMAFTYHESSGLEKERIYYQWKDEQWVPNLRFRAERDDTDRLINELIDQYREDNWQLSRKNSTAYKGSSHKSEQVYYNLKNSDWNQSYKDQYVFDSDKLVEKTGYRWNNSAWEKSLITHYSYNTAGNRIEENINRATPEGTREWRKTSFSYKDGIKNAGLVSVKKEEQWQESEKHIFHYRSL